MRTRIVWTFVLAAVLAMGCDKQETPSSGKTGEEQAQAGPEAAQAQPGPVEEAKAAPVAEVAGEAAAPGEPKVKDEAAAEVAKVSDNQGDKPMVEQSPEARGFLDWYNKEYESREGASAAAYWVAANSGQKEDFDAYAQADLQLKMLHSDKARYEELKALLAKGDSLDPLSRRSLAVSELMFRGNQLPEALLGQMVQASADIEHIFNTFRGTYVGEKKTNNDLLDILSKETDSSRRKEAWEALKEVGESVAPKLIALALLRNQAATSLGFKNFWDMQIRLQEHEPEMILDIFSRLEEATNEPFRKQKEAIDADLAKKFGIEPGQLMPWHYDNPFFQQAPPSQALDLDIFFDYMAREELVAITTRFFVDIGLPMDDLAAKSDFYEREGKDQHAFCITLNRADDVRMLLNVKPTSEWMDTLLHEAGHAVYYKYIDRSLPFNLREAAHIFTTEAVAMLFGALAKSPAWLVDYAHADKAKVEELAEALATQRKREQLIFARWTLVMLNFEKALYENPNQDLNTLWWDMVERYQFLKRPEGRNAADWASKPHFTIAPVYYHNYMLGELFAAQLRATLTAMAGHKGPTSTLSFTGRKDFGEFFINKVFRPGMTMTWPDFVKLSTGKALDITDFAAETR